MVGVSRYDEQRADNKQCRRSQSFRQLLDIIINSAGNDDIWRRNSKTRLLSEMWEEVGRSRLCLFSIRFAECESFFAYQDYKEISFASQYLLAYSAFCLLINFLI